MSNPSPRERLSGRMIQIRKRFDGNWEAYLFPNGDGLISMHGATGNDPVEAIVRLARILQELPR